MSALVGHLGLSGDPTSRIARMLGACVDRGSHQRQIESLPGPLPGAFGHAGHRATSHSVDEQRPLRHETGVTLTADIRLDNREALHDKLVGDTRPTGDAELALLAYLRWGRAFAEHLLGDFAIAIFDPRSGVITLARDHLGVRPLLYAHGDDWFVFGSTLSAVRDGADRSFEIYIDKLQHAMVDPLEVVEPETTFYQAIARLPAASTLRWTPGQAPTITTYWRPERGDLRLRSDEEYVEAFREVFDLAVACRLQTTQPLAAMLSGGLDSSSVVARAHTMVQDPLRTYGFVERSPEQGSDAAHIQACQRAFPGEHYDFAEDGIVQDYDLDILLSDPDSPFDVDMGVLWTTSRRMAQSGYGVVLTGLGGDEALALNQRRFATELLHSGKRLAAVREMSRADGTWSPKGLARFLAGELSPRWAIGAVRDLRKTNPQVAARMKQAGIDPTSDVGQRLDASFETLFERPEWNTGDPRVDRVGKPMLTIGLERYDRVGARHGVEVRHPMSDKRFIEFCLSLPSNQLQRQGWSKYIIRTAMGELPSSVGWRPKEVRGMGPAARAIRGAYGASHPVAALSGVFGDASVASDPRHDHWTRHVITRWWNHHG